MCDGGPVWVLVLVLVLGLGFIPSKRIFSLPVSSTLGAVGERVSPSGALTGNLSITETRCIAASDDLPSSAAVSALYRELAAPEQTFVLP